MSPNKVLICPKTMFSICPPTRPDSRLLIHHGLLTLLRPTIGTNRSRKRKFRQISLVLGTNCNDYTTTLDTLLSLEHLLSDPSGTDLHLVFSFSSFFSSFFSFSSSHLALLLLSPTSTCPRPPNPYIF